MSDLAPTKDELRRSLRRRRAAMSPAARADAAKAAAGLIETLPPWGTCRQLGLYQPAPDEFDGLPIAELARACGMDIYLPVIEDQRLSFARWAPDANLLPNRYGIPEPDAQARRIEPSELDLLLLPLVGWDRRGGRLGMGGGYYDRTLAVATRPPLAGLAYAAQEVEAIPTDPWDVPLDYVLTERELVSIAPGERG